MGRLGAIHVVLLPIVKTKKEGYDSMYDGN
jgi:hypothetical protein